MNAPNHRGMRRIDTNGLGYHIFMYFFFFNKNNEIIQKKNLLTSYDQIYLNLIHCNVIF